MLVVPEFTLTWIAAQENLAPVWLLCAADCEKNVLQWLADKGIKSPALDSYVLDCCELGMIHV
jgi:hypothetical protein